MTLPVDESNKMGALLSAVKRYPGGVRGLAQDMDIPESSLYAMLRGEKGYPLDYRERIDEILDFLRGQDVKDWARTIHVFCFRHDHLAIPIPRALKLGSREGLQQVSQLMQEVADIANALSDGLDSGKESGELINSRELKRIELACDEAMEKIAETLEWCRVQHSAAKKKGLVR